MDEKNSRPIVSLSERWRERREVLEERKRRQIDSDAARKRTATPAMALGTERVPRPIEILAAKRGWTYFIQAGCGSIKIGRATDVRYRLSELQCANPQELTLLAVAIDGSRETEYHRQFAEHCVRGEWFAPHADILAEIERLNAPAVGRQMGRVG